MMYLPLAVSVSKVDAWQELQVVTRPFVMSMIWKTGDPSVFGASTVVLQSDLQLAEAGSGSLCAVLVQTKSMQAAPKLAAKTKQRMNWPH